MVFQWMKGAHVDTVRTGIRFATSLVVLCCMFVSPALFAEARVPELGFSLLAVSPAEGTAVISYYPNADSAQKMGLVTIGDQVPGADFTVSQVLPDRIVMRAHDRDAARSAQVVWMYIAGSDGRSAITRVGVDQPNSVSERVRVENQSD